MMRTFKELTTVEQKIIRVLICETKFTDQEISVYFNLKLQSISSLKKDQLKRNKEFEKELLRKSNGCYNSFVPPTILN
jgi:hypothetical protein